MNTQRIAQVFAASLFAVASFSAFADDIGYPGNLGVAPSSATPLTRAEVRAQVLASRSERLNQSNDFNYPAETSAAVARSRSEVLAELRASQLTRENGIVIGQ